MSSLLGTPFISQEVLSQCPSEAEYDNFPRILHPHGHNQQVDTRIYTVPSRTGSSQSILRIPTKAIEATHKRSRVPPAETVAGVKCVTFNLPEGTPSGRLNSTCFAQATYLDRTISAVTNVAPDLSGSAEYIETSPQKAPEQRASDKEEKQLSPEAEETIRVMEWSKKMVMQAVERSREVERRMYDSAKFSLLLSKWRAEAKLRAHESQQPRRNISHSFSPPPPQSEREEARYSKIGCSATRRAFDRLKHWFTRCLNKFLRRSNEKNQG